MATPNDVIDVLRVLASQAYREGHHVESMSVFRVLDSIAEGDDFTDRNLLGVAMLESGDATGAKALLEQTVLAIQPYNEVALLAVAEAGLQQKSSNWDAGCKTVLATSQLPEMRSFAQQLMDSTPS